MPIFQVLLLQNGKELYGLKKGFIYEKENSNGADSDFFVWSDNSDIKKKKEIHIWICFWDFETDFFLMSCL